MSLSGQRSVLSFCPFVVLHGPSSRVVMHPQKIMVKTCDNTLVTASLVLVYGPFMNILVLIHHYIGGQA